MATFKGKWLGKDSLHGAPRIPYAQKKTYDTPPKINIEPENDGLEDVFPVPGVYSQVPC